MKKVRLLSLLLAVIMLLLCACASNTPDVSDDLSPDVSKDGPVNEPSDTPSDESSYTPSDDQSDTPSYERPTLEDCLASEYMRWKYQDALSFYLNEKHATDDFGDAQKLAVIKLEEKGYEPTLARYEYMCQKALDYGWCKAKTLEMSEKSDPSRPYICCKDTGGSTWLGDTLIASKNDYVVLTWCFPDLAPRFSELLADSLTESPIEDQLEYVSKMLLITYFKELGNWPVGEITIDEYYYGSNYLAVTVYRFLTPYSEDGRERGSYYEKIAEIDFSYDDEIVSMANKNHSKKEKYALQSISIFKDPNHPTCEYEYKSVITPEEAFDNYLSTYQDPEYAESFKGNVYKSYIAYKTNNDANTYEPYWFFVWRSQENNEFYTFETPATKE